VPTLDIRNLGVRYASKAGTVDALSNVNLAVRDGDFVVAIGASGCGKTTLLSCIAGFLPPTEGTITLDGKPVVGPGADRGVVFQKHALMPWLNVISNVEFGLRMRGVPPNERRRIAMEKLSLVGLEEFADRAIYELSGGMQQRVGMARALLHAAGQFVDRAVCRNSQTARSTNCPAACSSAWEWRARSPRIPSSC